MATPLIRIPQEQGGTLYAFANAARDLTRSYYNPDLNFEFSKFALIKVPAVTVPSLGSTNNYIEFNKLFDASGVSYNDTTANGNANIHFAQTFQNYALNLEQLVLNDDDFDSTILASDAEKLFFKYLNRIGAFEVRTATSQESIGSLSRVIEFDDSVQTGAEYERVIKYLGNIDVSNDKNYKGDVYNEIFINVPSAVGYTPNVLLKSGTYNTNSLQYTPGGFIEGRIGQTHPDVNLNLDSITDDANSEISIDPNEVSRVENALGIDFDPQSYAKIVNDTQLHSIFDYSKRGGDFTFNAILVYYDLYSKSTPVNKATNLYGILILDNFKEDPNGSGWFIPSQTKYKPNDITGLNGNAFSLKLNVKFNSSMDNVGVENNINDFSTFGMDIFLDTVSSLNNTTKLLKEANDKYLELFKRVADMESLILTSSDIAEVKNKIQLVEQDLINAKLNMSESSSLLKLIQSTNLKINKMLDGEKVRYVSTNRDLEIRFRFLDKQTDTYTTEYNSNGFDLPDEFKLNRFKKSFFRLYFYDSNSGETSNLLFTEDIPVIQKNEAVFPLRRLYWDRNDDLMDNSFKNRVIYMEARFFNAKTGQIQTFYNPPITVTSPIDVKQYGNYNNRGWRLSPITLINPNNYNGEFRFQPMNNVGANTPSVITLSEFIIK